MTFEELQDLLAEQFSCDTGDLTRSTALEDLDADHEDMIELAWALGEAIGVEIVQAEHRKAYKLLADNKRKLDEIAQYLYEKETISGEEFMRILNAQPQLPAGTSADSTNAVQ